MTDAIIQKLVANVEVQNEVGRNKVDNKFKVYPVVCAQPEQHPYIVIRLTGKRPRQCKGRRASDFDADFEAYSFAKTYAKTEAMDAAVLYALDNQGFTQGNIIVQNVTFNTSRDDFSDKFELYARVSSFTAVIHESPITT